MKTKIANGLLIFLLIICVILLSFLAYRKINPPLTVTKDKSDRILPTAAAIKKLHPAEVNIQTTSILPEMADTSVSGTGCIIDSSGIILTNFHVVSKPELINITLRNGDSYKARIIVADPENDIALLKIENPQTGLPVIPFMRPWKLKSSEKSVPIGDIYSPRRVIPVGTLSRINRPFANVFIDLLQNASSNALINPEGSLIGMNMAVKQDFQGIRFAVPLHRIENILAKHLLPERMLSMSLGFYPEVSQDGKIIVRRVYPGSPAHRAGIRRGMEIYSFQGWNPKHDLIELSRRLIRLKPGDPVNLVLSTAGNVTLTPVPFADCPAHVPIFWKLGIFAANMDHHKAAILRYPFHTGVIVSGVSRSSGIKMFRQGDVIIGWNKKKIENMEDLKKEIENAPIGSRAFVTVYSPVLDPERGPSLIKHVYPVVIR